MTSMMMTSLWRKPSLRSPSSRASGSYPSLQRGKTPPSWQLHLEEDTRTRSQATARPPEEGVTGVRRRLVQSAGVVTRQVTSGASASQQRLLVGSQECLSPENN